MEPDNLPFNVLVVGPTNLGKSQFVVDQLYGPFSGTFDYIVLICLTFTHNKTFQRLGEKDPRMFIVICEQHEVELCLKVARFLFEDTNTLIVLDDCAASKSRFFDAPHGHQRLGADPEVHKHHGLVPGKCGGGRAFLHPRRENEEKHL